MEKKRRGGEGEDEAEEAATVHSLLHLYFQQK